MTQRLVSLTVIPHSVRQSAPPPRLELDSSLSFRLIIVPSLEPHSRPIQPFATSQREPTLSTLRACEYVSAAPYSSSAAAAAAAHRLLWSELTSHRKFGKQIQRRQLDLPEYAASFVNYKALKKVGTSHLPRRRLKVHG